MKKTFLKIVSLALVASFGFAFAACSKKDENKLVMACSADFPPYEFHDTVDGNDVVTGIDVEIMTAICDKLGLTLEVQDVAFDSIIAGVQSGKYDVGMSGITVNEDRLTQVNFSTPYTTAVQSILLPEGSDITDIETLLEGDYTVGVQTGTTGDIYMTDDVGDDRVVRFTKYSDAVQALLTGNVDCVCLDNQPAIAFADANESLYILDTAYAFEDYAIAINLENEDLLNDVNNALAELTADGTIAAIIEKYIPSEG